MNTGKYLALSLLTIFMVTSCTKDAPPPRKPAQMTIAAEMSLLPATVWVAEELGYFKDENLDLTIREFDSGRNALEAMLKDKTINIATVAQTPIVFNSFNSENYAIIATMAHSIDDVKVLARKDHDISKAADLKGKKIGATLRSTGHYFLEGFLSNHDLSLDDIELIDVNAAELKDKLISGELDAITSWEPHIYNTKKVLDDSKLTMLINPTPFRKDFFFTADKEYINKNSKEISRFLKAVIQAESFIKNNTNKAQAIISNRIKADPVIVEYIWNEFFFEITLEQSILLGLEDEAQWAVDIGATSNAIPNYLEFIDYSSLRNIKPDAVNIFH